MGEWEKKRLGQIKLLSSYNFTICFTPFYFFAKKVSNDTEFGTGQFEMKTMNLSHKCGNGLATRAIQLFAPALADSRSSQSKWRLKASAVNKNGKIIWKQ